jgi:hypothetical protein
LKPIRSRRSHGSGTWIANFHAPLSMAKSLTIVSLKWKWLIKTGRDHCVCHRAGNGICSLYGSHLIQQDLYTSGLTGRGRWEDALDSFSAGRRVYNLQISIIHCFSL